MKRLITFGAIASIAFFPSISFAQCTTLSTTVSYDAVVTGSGNDMYTFTVPKFDASLGDLLEVHLTSEVTIIYSYNVENRDTRLVPNVRVRVVREDEISSPDMETPLSNIFNKTTNPFSLGPRDAIVEGGADYHAEGPIFIMNKTVLDKVTYNTTAFMGAGDVELTYLTSTYGLVLGSALNNFSQTTNDEMRFKVTYQYCPTKSVLDEDIKTFNVTRKDDKAQVNWTTANDHNRKYEVQTSTDGKTYSTVYKTMSTSDGNGVGSYLYNHSLPRDASGKLLFRVKIINNDGSFHYTTVKVIELPKRNTSALKIFPNPAQDEVRLLFDNSKRGNWKVFLLTSTGQALKEYTFTSALTGRLLLQGMLPKGTYFIKAININTQESQATRLVIK